jgi:hypothetical protein
MTSSTEYRDIPEYPGYRVGEDGTVWSCRKPRGRGCQPCRFSQSWHQLRPNVNEHGYHQVSLTNATGTAHWYRIHQLVARAFVSNEECLREINHKNGNKADNAARNLEWTTRSANIRHAFRTGLNKPRRGEQCAHAKLTAQQVFAIRRLRQRGQTLTTLAVQFGVSITGVWNILNGRSWKHIAERYTQRELFQT